VGAVSSLLLINWTGSLLIAEIDSFEILSWLLEVHRFIFIRHEGHPASVFVLAWMGHSQRVGLFSFQNGHSLVFNGDRCRRFFSRTFPLALLLPWANTTNTSF